MADAITLIKAPEEKMSNFNTRLKNSCGEFPVTNAQLAIVDGQPCVTLFSESVEAEAEDVEEADAAGEKLEVGELIPSEEPVCVQVCSLHSHDVASAAKSQQRMDTLYKRANGAVTSVLHASGRDFVSIVDESTKKDSVMEKDVHFVAVIYNPDDADDKEQANDAGTPADG